MGVGRKACADCAHCETRFESDHWAYYCARKSPLINRITGAASYPTCNTERAFSVHSRFLGFMRRCGPEGIHFKAKERGPVRFEWATPSE